jgi:hypothetical protein
MKKQKISVETAQERIAETLRLAACCAESIARGQPITVTESGELGFDKRIADDMLAVPALAEAGRIDQIAALLDARTLLLLQLAFAPCNVVARHPGGGASRPM